MKIIVAPPPSAPTEPTIRFWIQFNAVTESVEIMAQRDERQPVVIAQIPTRPGTMEMLPGMAAIDARLRALES